MKAEVVSRIPGWSRGRCWIASAVIFSFFTGIALALPNPILEEAERLYQQTQYSQAVDLLDINQGITAPEYTLLGKCYYKMEKYKKAAETLEKAVLADPRNSRNMNWLGKAYGRRAETSLFFTALSYASKARHYFEQAVELNPTNWDALDDLSD